MKGTLSINIILFWKEVNNLFISFYLEGIKYISFYLEINFMKIDWPLIYNEQYNINTILVLYNISKVC